MILGFPADLCILQLVSYSDTWQEEYRDHQEFYLTRDECIGSLWGWPSCQGFVFFECGLAQDRNRFLPEYMQILEVPNQSREMRVQ